MPTIKDVAKEAGVSIATVSYVLNNKTESISEETRELVLEAARRIGYAPNVTARNLRYSQTRLIGYAWHEVPRDTVNPVMDRFTYHLAYAAEEAGYHVLTFTHPPHAPTPVYDELIRTRRLDAFILSAITPNDPRIELLLKRKFPFATFGRSNFMNEHPWVDVDGAHGVTEALSYFVELGHRRIAMVAWDDNSSASNYRIDGYKVAMRTLGLPLRDDYIWLGDHSEDSGRAAMARWLKLPPSERPTAVMGISDLEAIGVMNEAQERGLIIGEDISVIGFDDVPMANYLRPSLTTLHQPIPEVAKALVGMLIALLEHRRPDPFSMLMKPTLVKRASVGPPRS